MAATSDLLSQVGNLERLRRAWHVARDDARSDFVTDSYHLNDFAYALEEHLNYLSGSLTSEAYLPRPATIINIPKSTLLSRPGSLLDIEDRIVLFSILELIGPTLDQTLRPNVKSSRVRKDKEGRVVVESGEELQVRIPRAAFLPKRVIHQEISFWEPWYEAWPKFQEELQTLAQSHDFPYLVVTDVSSYFENIELGILEQDLLRNLPDGRSVTNFLIHTLLRRWTRPAEGLSPVPRGIPQGNGVSSFLGTFYLHPLDDALAPLEESEKIGFLRWVDDLEVFARDYKTARQVVRLIDDKLRDLRLNIQGAKTEILEGDRLIKHVEDDRLNSLNDVIEATQRNPNLSESKLAAFREQVRAIHRTLRIPEVLDARDGRVYRRLLTACSMLGEPCMLSRSFDQLNSQPDHRTIRKTMNYFRALLQQHRAIYDLLVARIANSDSLFDYDEALCFETLRYLVPLDDVAWSLAFNRLEDSGANWMVRREATMLVSLKLLNASETRRLYKLFADTQTPELRKVLLRCLCQTSSREFLGPLKQADYSGHPSLVRASSFFRSLLDDEVEGLRHITRVFSEVPKPYFVDRLPEIEVLSRSESEAVKVKLLRKLRQFQGRTGRPVVDFRLEAVSRRLSRTLPEN